MTTSFAGHILGPDVHANRPAATAVPPGTLYSCNEHDIVYRSDGATWTSWAIVVNNNNTAPVDSVNGQTGIVTLDADDIDDTATAHKFATASQLTKIDGVESGATADQTAAEIMTAIQTVDGAASGLDADLLDGLEGSDFARSQHQVDFITALDSATVTHTDTLVVGRGAPDQQTVQISHVSSDGATETNLVQVTVPANSTAAITPPTFSVAVVAGDRIRFQRIAGTGTPPVGSVLA